MIVGSLLSLGLAWQAVSPEVVQHAKAGLAAREAGQLETAIHEFKQVTELAPALPAGFVNLGAAYMQSHDYARAIPPLRKALELKSDQLGAEQMLGYALLSEGYVRESIPYFEQARVSDGLGIAQVRAGKYQEAIGNLTAALAKRPDDPELLYYLGRASGLLSKEANDTLQDKFADSARAQEALAENYAVLRQVPEAEKHYREALRLAPEARGTHLALGQLYAKTGDWSKAEPEFRAETRLQPGDAESAYWLGNALIETGHANDARTELERADRLRPAMPETLSALAKASAAVGDPAGAETAWRKQLSIEPSGKLAAQAHFGLAALYRKQGRSADAAQEIREYQRLK